MITRTEFILLDSLCDCVSSVIVADFLEPRVLLRLLDYINEVVSIDFREEDRVAFNEYFLAVFRFLITLWLDLIRGRPWGLHSAFLDIAGYILA